MHSLIDLAPVIAASEPTPHESWIQILKTGEFQHPKDGTIRITRETLHRMKENFDAKVRGTDLAVDISHNPDAGAVGWFKELRLEGDKLMALVAWTDEGAELVRSGKYRYFSPEFAFGWTHPEKGTKFRDVLFGGALTNRPFLKDMQPVAFSEHGMATLWYDPDHDGDDDRTTNPKTNPDWMEDVRRGINTWDQCTPEQQEELKKHGLTKDAADKAHAEFLAAHPHLKMAEDVTKDGITNAHATPPKGKPQNRDLYADPAHYKYPIDRKHIQAAVDFYNDPANRTKGGYHESQWAEIGKRIAAAASRLLVKDGYHYADGHIETPTNHVKASEGYDPDSAPTDDWSGGGGVVTPHRPTDTDPGQYHEPQGGILLSEGGKTITMADWEAAQKRIQLLEAETRRKTFAEEVRGWLFDEQTQTGKLVPAQAEGVVEFMMSLSDEQVAAFREVMNGLPARVQFGEIGTAVGTGTTDKEAQVVKLAEKLERERGISWKEAMIEAASELGVS